MADEPQSLGELINMVIDRHGYRSLADMQRQTSIPYQTLWAWQQGLRSVKRPPSPVVLKIFAADYGLPEAMVFRAAGRKYDETGGIDAESQELLHLWQQLTDQDRRTVDRLIRDLIARR